MTETASIITHKIVGLGLRDAVTSFALNSMLSQFAHVRPIEHFSLRSRAFETYLYPPDLVVTDLDKCSLERVPFETEYARQAGSEFIAFIPTHIASVYYFRLQRAKIPICLWRNGLTPVVKAAESILASVPVPAESVLDVASMNFLSYGTKDGSELRNMHPQLRPLVPRLNFDLKILATELNHTLSELQTMIKTIHENFEVQNNFDAIKVAESRGISQLPTQQDSVEKKILEDSAVSAIARWLTKQSQSTKRLTLE